MSSLENRRRPRPRYSCSKAPAEDDDQHDYDVEGGTAGSSELTLKARQRDITPHTYRRGEFVGEA
jgi:hypothetical protein